MNPDAFNSIDRAGYTASMLGAFGLSVVLLGTLLVLAVAWEAVHRRRATRARAALAVTAHGGLAPGYAAVQGRVEPDGERAPVVSVSITQRGIEGRDKQGTYQRWTETQREVQSRPFDLRLAHGERVRVEPDSAVQLVDTLDETERLARDRRVRRAKLTAGEEVFVVGALAPGLDPQAGVGYRDAGRGLVLRAPRGARMVISSEGAQDRHARREGFHGKWALALAVTMAVFGVGIFGQFHLLLATGRTVQAELATVYTWQTWVHPKNQRPYQRMHYGVRARYTDPRGATRMLSDESNYAALNNNGLLRRDARDGSFTVVPGGQVPFVVSSIAPAVYQVGERATTDEWRLVLAWFVLPLLAFVYWIATVNTRAWYDRRRVVDLVRGAL